MGQWLGAKSVEILERSLGCRSVGLNRSEDLLDVLTNRSELEVGLPDLIEIHPVIGMNQEISHSRHTAPGEMIVLLA